MATGSNTSNRIEEFDILKGFGILTVVLFHSVFYNFSTYSPTTKHILYFFGPFGTPVVVIFFFVSGFLGYRSYEKSKNPWNFISKKLKIFLPPYFLWSTIYLVLQVLLVHYTGTLFHLNFFNILSGYLFATAYLPFYFLFVLLILYIFTPLFFNFKNIMLLMMIVSFAFGIIFTFLYYVPQYYGHMIINSTITYRNPLLWAFFYLWGMYASKNENFFWTKKPSCWIWLGFLISYVGTMAMIFTVPKLSFDYEAYIALSPFGYLLYFFSMPIFLWLSYIVKNRTYSKFLSLFGEHSLDIYMDHIFIIGLILAAFIPFVPNVTLVSNFYIQVIVGITACLVTLGIGVIVKNFFKKAYSVVF